MPLLTLHLLRCAPNTSASALLSAVRAESSLKIILASQPQYTVIAPQHVDREALLSQAWDLLLLIQSASSPIALPSALQPLIAAAYTVQVGIPSRLLDGFAARNALLRAQPPPAPTGSLEAARESSELPGGERLEVNRELLGFMEAFERRHPPNTPMTMLNLLSFHPNGKESYAKYGRAFVEVAGRRGGDAKLVGNVVPSPRGAGNASDAAADGEGEHAWHEVSLVHYPSIRSFCDMLAGRDYQDINERYRLNALRDTFLLATTETFDTEARGASRL